MKLEMEGNGKGLVFWTWLGEIFFVTGRVWVWSGVGLMLLSCLNLLEN